MNRGGGREGFILAETLAQNGTAGVNGRWNLTPVSTRVSGRMKPPLGGISSVNLNLSECSLSLGGAHLLELHVLLLDGAHLPAIRMTLLKHRVNKAVFTLIHTLFVLPCHTAMHTI